MSGLQVPRGQDPGDLPNDLQHSARIPDRACIGMLNSLDQQVEESTLSTSWSQVLAIIPSLTDDAARMRDLENADISYSQGGSSLLIFWK